MWKCVLENVSNVCHRWLITETWRHKLFTAIVKLCDVIFLWWLIGGKHLIHFLKHIFTRIINLLSNFIHLQPLARKSTMKKVKISWWANFVGQLWLIDITCVEGYMLRRYRRGYKTCWVEKIFNLWCLVIVVARWKNAPKVTILGQPISFAKVEFNKF